jgi:hypothetical protein
LILFCGHPNWEQFGGVHATQAAAEAEAEAEAEAYWGWPIR